MGFSVRHKVFFYILISSSGVGLQFLFQAIFYHIWSSRRSRLKKLAYRAEFSAKPSIFKCELCRGTEPVDETVQRHMKNYIG